MRLTTCGILLYFLALTSATVAQDGLDWLNNIHLRSPESGTIDFVEAISNGREVLLIGRNGAVGFINEDQKYRTTFWDTPQSIPVGGGYADDHWYLYTDRLYSSEDGLNWSVVNEAPVDQHAFAIFHAVDGNVFLTAWKDTVSISSDTITWTVITQPFAQTLIDERERISERIPIDILRQGIKGFFQKSEKFFLTYDQAYPTIAPGGFHNEFLSFETTNGMDWVRSSTQDPSEIINPSISIHPIFEYKKDGRIIQIDAHGSVFVSADEGVNWEQKLDLYYYNPRELTAFWSSQDLIFAASKRGLIYQLDPSVSDYEWTESLRYLEDQPGTFSNVAFGNGLFVAINANGNSYISLSGKQWTKGRSFKKITNDLYDSTLLRFHDGYFILRTGPLQGISSSNPDESPIYLSRDGIAWEKIEPTPAQFIRANGQFIRSGFPTSNSIIYDWSIETSVDGENWTRQLTDAEVNGRLSLYSDGVTAYADIRETSDIRRLRSTDGGNTWNETISHAPRDATKGYPRVENEIVWIDEKHSGEWEPLSPVFAFETPPSTIHISDTHNHPLPEYGFFHTGGGFGAQIARGRGSIVIAGHNHFIFQTDIDPSLQPSRLANLSTRGFAGVGEQSLILGFVLRGTSTENYLLRGAGPSLASFDIQNPASNPQIKLFKGSQRIATNDDWNQFPDIPNLTTATATAGAFSFSQNSRDAAMVAGLRFGVHSIVVTNQESPGIALAEIYSLDPSSGKLRNLSSRCYIEPNHGLAIGGLVITGEKPLTLLIRGIGPGLKNYGIQNPLTDPKIEIYRNQTLFFSNSDYRDAADSGERVIALSAAAGAFPLSSGDTALEFAAPPGIYTFHLKSEDNQSGVALLEIYKLDR